MTEYELLDLMGTWKANAALSLMALLLLLAAYLLLAQTAGRTMLRTQVIIVTCLMLWFSGIIIAAVYTSLQTLIDLRELGSHGYTTIRRARFFMWLITLGCLIAPLTCIHYMILVRHHLPERRRTQ
jgi:hypothetical protein